MRRRGAIGRSSGDVVNVAGVGVVHVLPDLSVAGGPRYVLDLVRSSPEGSIVRHHVAALADGGMRDRFEAASIPTFVLHGSGPTGLARSSVALARIVRRERLDVVHTNGTPADRLVGQTAAALGRAAVVNTFHGLPLADLPEPPGGRGRRAELRRLLRRRASVVMHRANVSAVLAVSDLVRRAHAAALGVDPNGIGLVSPGLPPEMLDAPRADRTAVRRELGIGGDRPDDVTVLVNVGRFDPGKGQELLVDVVAALARRQAAGPPDRAGCPPVLLLVGDGVRRRPAEERAARLGVAAHVRFAGTRDDIAALLDASDVYLTASHNEGFGIAPLEAMARRLPVVAVAGAHTAVAEFVDDGETGVLVPEPSADALADAVAVVLADPERSMRLGRAAVAAARSRSFTETARRVEETYASVTAGKHR